jgi:hypothetical protein
VFAKTQRPAKEVAERRAMTRKPIQATITSTGTAIAASVKEIW